MQVVISSIPDIQNYMQYISPVSLSSDITIIVVYRTMFRSDDVLIDIYLNEITDDTKIISSRKLSTDAIMCLPKYDIGFNYWVNCVDPNNVGTSINKYNAQKFYLQFTLKEHEDWEF